MPDLRDSIIALAREEAAGRGDAFVTDALIDLCVDLTLYARLARAGVTPGYLRLPPSEAPKVLRLDDRKPIA